jgi:serine phosphatase RsbU (regulator of sigma subunit)
MIEVLGPSVLLPAESTDVAVSSALRSYDGGERCGDAILVFGLHSGRQAIVVLDVAGHGRARSPLSSAVAEAICTSLRSDGSPAAALESADARLRTLDDDLPYAVAFAAVIHPVTRTVVYASAGHDVAFTLADDGRVRDLAPTAPMLGIPLPYRACDATFMLAPGETLVVVTDGISDSRPAGSNRFFGVAGTAFAIARALRRGDDPAHAVLAAAEFHRGAQLDDDAGAVAVRLPPALTSLKGSTDALDHHRHFVHSVALGLRDPYRGLADPPALGNRRHSRDLQPRRRPRCPSLTAV